VKINEQPFGVPMTTPFTEDIEHASWDRDSIERFGRLLDWTDTVLDEFSGWFSGQRLVQRQDEPGAPLLAQLRPRGQPLLWSTGPADGC
jgi:Family of unknown function (DUF5996)